jgi:hypothetical protein
MIIAQSAQCYSAIKDSDIDHMFAQAPEVIQQVRTNGAVTDELLDRLGIVKLPNEHTSTETV